MNDNAIPAKAVLDLRQAHFTVRLMKKLLDPGYKDSTGLLNGMRKSKVLRVKVSKEQVGRALCFMDKLIKALEARGAKFVKVADSDAQEIRIDGERIESVLIEETRRIERADEDSAPNAWRFNRWEWRATGRLRFEIQEYTGKNGQKKWADSKSRSLEEQLGEIVETLFGCAKDLKQLEKERAEEQRRWNEEQRQREAAAQREALEQNRRKNLVEQSQQWVRSINLRSFIDVCEKQMLSNNAGQLSPDSWEVVWLAWARQHVVRLDPLQNGFLESQKRGEHTDAGME